ncbi:hypothetical protein M413DRAFT_424748 [Hebeloma cylindrosporum]|uniref:Uncharacterized protein n=1 Tax=Hebeloma cylindrosporum TaxID=76867 RepID=A0A0C2Y6E6_HEBCY|nr:hypothetical protein M413DRAFT_424748 [Hebeloma cylindrosporum h7]
MSFLFKAVHGSAIINIVCMEYEKLPPAVWKTSLLMHCLCHFIQILIEVLNSAIYLMHVGGTSLDYNLFIFEVFDKIIINILSSIVIVRHPFLYCLIRLSFHHSNKLAGY